MRWKDLKVFGPEAEGAGSGGEAVATGEAAPSPTPAPVEGQEAQGDQNSGQNGGGQQPWFIGRINSLTAQKKGAEERLQAAEAELARLREAASRGTTSGLTEDEVERRAAEKAEKLAAEKAVKLAEQQVFNSRLGEMGNEGRKEFGAEFNTALQTFQTSFGNLPNDFLEACLESGVGHRVLMELSKDLDRAATLMTAPSPAKMTAGVLKFAAELSTKRKVTPPAGGRTSAAPPPIEPRVGGGNTSGGDPLEKAQSMADWVKIREQQLRSR